MRTYISVDQYDHLVTMPGAEFRVRTPYLPSTDGWQAGEWVHAWDASKGIVVIPETMLYVWPSKAIYRVATKPAQPVDGASLYPAQAIQIIESAPRWQPTSSMTLVCYALDAINQVALTQWPELYRTVELYLRDAQERERHASRAMDIMQRAWRDKGAWGRHLDLNLPGGRSALHGSMLQFFAMTPQDYRNHPLMMRKALEYHGRAASLVHPTLVDRLRRQASYLLGPSQDQQAEQVFGEVGLGWKKNASRSRNT